MAGKVLFLPTGPVASLESSALYRAESSACGFGFCCGDMVLVKRCCALWDSRIRSLFVHGLWAEHWNPSSWKEYLAAGETEDELRAIRQSTHTGRPLGEEEFVRDLEEATKRSLSPQTGGRPAKLAEDSAQTQLTFEI